VSTGSLIEVPASFRAESCSNKSWSSFDGDLFFFFFLVLFFFFFFFFFGNWFIVP